MNALEVREHIDQSRVLRHHQASPKRRRARRRWTMLVVLLLVLMALSTGSALFVRSIQQQSNDLQARITAQLEIGQQQLEAGKASLKQANTAHDAKFISDAKTHFTEAKLRFSSVRKTADDSELVRQLMSVPYVGRAVQSRRDSVDAVADMGVQLSNAGLDLSDLELQLLQPTGASQQGRTLLTVLDAVKAKIPPVRSELKAALAAAQAVDLNIVSADQRASLIRATGSIKQGLAAVDQLNGLLPVATEVLGGNGVRTLLIEQVNPAELRAGGGFIGTYSILRVDHGRISLVQSGNGYDLSEPRPAPGQPGYVVPPGPIREFIPNTSWSFIDSNFFPDFPSNAKQAEAFVQPRLGTTIDGVIAIDYWAVAKMLEVTGPISVPGFNVTLTSDNFVSTLLNYDVNTLLDPHASAVHKAILGAVAGPLLQRIVDLQPSQWSSLLNALNDVAAGRHLQSYFNNGDVESAMTDFGWSAALRPTATADYMMEVESNLGGTKANAFVTRSYTVTISRNGATLHHVVSVDIKDDMPYFYRPNEFYRAYVRMYISGKASNVSDDLVRPRYPNPAPPAGTQVLDGWMSIHGYGHDRLVTFQWDTSWQPNGRGVEQIYWQKQPGTQADRIDVTWIDGNGHTYKLSGDLGQDRVITLAPSGLTLAAGQVGTAQLPSLSLG